MSDSRVWTVGYGGQGAWHNVHFNVRAEAEAFMATEIAYLRTVYPRMRTHETLEGDTFTIVNILKSGGLGKLKQTVRIREMERPCTNPYCLACRQASGKAEYEGVGVVMEVG